MFFCNVLSVRERSQRHLYQRIISGGLVNCEEADFVYLRETTGATAGNLSVQIDKLSVGYITVEKCFRGKKPHTVCKISAIGLKAFEDYIDALKSYFNK